MTEDCVDELKRALKVESDSDLARTLAVDRRTVSSWRARGALPKRYAGILAGDPKQAISFAPLGWGQFEEVAFELALFRFSRFVQSINTDKSSVVMLEFGAAAAGFWSLMLRSQQDLAKLLENDQASDVRHALVIAILQDTDEPQSALDRDREILMPRRGNQNK